jgi:hypothetical protein
MIQNIVELISLDLGQFIVAYNCDDVVTFK